jgi:hypothetical protein
MPGNRRRPKKVANPGRVFTPKIPRYLGDATLENRHIAWRFSSIDADGPYKCSGLPYGDLQRLFDRLREFEKMNVGQLRDDGSYHPVQTSQISKPAKARLESLQLDDIDELHSFRITSTCRLWCMKYESLMSLLWWDKGHEVYPVRKKHT